MPSLVVVTGIPFRIAGGLLSSKGGDYPRRMALLLIPVPVQAT